ncbi:MAG: hypothetical protein WCT04_07745 [Planctomycetota bacterium]
MTMKKALRTILITCVILVIAAGTTQAARMLWIETGSDAARATAGGDPVEKQIRGETLAVIPELRQKPVPSQRIQIPDPQEWQKLIGLKDQPADNDPPVTATDSPPRPVLPVAPAPVK